jgi:uncharacterized protein (DUF1800 family)
MQKLMFGLVAALAAATLASRAADYSAFDRRLAGDEKILHALNRLSFGPRPGDVEAVRRTGLEKWIDQQLHPERIAENPNLAALLAPLDSLTMSASEAAEKYQPRLLQQQAEQGAKQKGKAALQNPRQQERMAAMDPEARHDFLEQNAPALVPVFDLTEAKLYRAIYSERQLEELLVDFWFNHFNVNVEKGPVRLLAASYERDAIRPHVLGKFRDLLGATAESPTMLFYLDNWQSVSTERIQEQVNRLGRFGKVKAKAEAKLKGRGLNENYARELMELHTLGVDGGYTQDDVVNVARAFTGWTIDQPRQGGGFRYDGRVHDNREKIVLDVTIPAGGGRSDGERVLDLLAAHPSTAQFISLKLAQRFVADDPPPGLVGRMAETYRSTGGDIRSVMETMLQSKEFFSEGARQAKIKTPLEFVASAARAVNAEVTYAIPLANRIAELGQPLYRKVEPTGYSTMAGEWVNSAALLARMNFALALAANRIPGSTVAGSALSADPVEMARRLLFREPSPQTAAAIQKGLDGRAATPELAAGLVLGSPDFQRR